MNGNPLPLFRRARGYRLYDHSGQRYLDLYQGNGSGLLGHRAFRITTELKDVISRGLISDLPSVYLRRMEKALLGQFPEYRACRIVCSRARALELASHYMGSDVDKACDPLIEPESDSPLKVWRPFCALSTSSEILLLILPFMMGGAPVCLVFRGVLPVDFPPSDNVSPVILAGALRALHNLKRYQPASWFREDLLCRAPGWNQRGIYILPAFEAGSYREVFNVFLKGGILLSPEYPGPSILPAEASEGEYKKMIKLFEQNPGE